MSSLSASLVRQSRDRSDSRGRSMGRSLSRSGRDRVRLPQVTSLLLTVMLRLRFNFSKLKTLFLNINSRGQLTDLSKASFKLTSSRELQRYLEIFLLYKSCRK